VSKDGRRARPWFDQLTMSEQFFFTQTQSINPD
jgi:hypothetical protein